MSEAGWTQLPTEDEAAGWVPLAPPPEEAEFQAGVRDTGWFREYVQEHGEEPDLRPMSEDPKQGPNYDYRRAWNAGIRPTRAKYDRGKYHWPSSTPEGEHLKSKNHPTRWKEDYMREYGADPDAQSNFKRMREPTASEQEFFRKNPTVAGMAAVDDKVILNPNSKLSASEKNAVILNERARIKMRNDPNLTPDFALTTEQQNFINKTVYKNARPVDQKATIAGRILSGDPSAGRSTPEQLNFVERLRKSMRGHGTDPDAQPQLRQGPPPWSSPIDRIAYNWNRQGGAEGLKEAAGKDVTKVTGALKEWNQNLRSGDPLREERAITQLTMLLAGGAATRGVLKLGAAGNFSKSTLGMFAGEKAATANYNMLARAKQWQNRGASREQIWKETGWFQGGDGKWRFEIDDRAAFLNKEGYEKFRRRRPGSEEPLTNVFQHPLAREAYPGGPSQPGGKGFDDIRLTRGETTPDVGGEHGYGGASSGEAWDRMLLDVGGKGPAQGAAGTRSTALHELQHHIQEMEGFAQGGDPMHFFLNREQFGKIQSALVDIKAGRHWLEAKAQGRNWEDFEKAFKRKYNRDPDSDVQSYNDADLGELKQMEEFVMQRLRDAIDPNSTYLHLAGEAEARLVQRRANYTPQQRRDIPPWYDLERMGYPERKLSYRRREDNPFLVD